MTSVVACLLGTVFVAFVQVPYKVYRLVCIHGFCGSFRIYLQDHYREYVKNVLEFHLINIDVSTNAIHYRF